MGVDVALLQEVGSGAAPSLPEGMETGGRGHWDSHTWTPNYPAGRFRTRCDRWPMVVKLSDRVEIEWFDQVGPDRQPKEERDLCQPRRPDRRRQGDPEGPRGR